MSVSSQTEYEVLQSRNNRPWVRRQTCSKERNWRLSSFTKEGWIGLWFLIFMVLERGLFYASTYTMQLTTNPGNNLQTVFQFVKTIKEWMRNEQLWSDSSSYSMTKRYSNVCIGGMNGKLIVQNKEEILTPWTLSFLSFFLWHSELSYDQIEKIPSNNNISSIDGDEGLTGTVKV